MDARYYCGTVNAELTALKARAYDIMRQIEKTVEEGRVSFSI